MKPLCFFIFLFVHIVSSAQQETSSENLFIITTDGFRWQEIFTGADSALIANPRCVQDSALMKQLYWDQDANIRRKKLMPFFWSTIASQGQLYGNREYENKIDVTNFYKISYPGYNEMLTGFPDPVFIPNIPLQNRNQNILEWMNSKPGFAGKVAAFSSWNIFPAILNRKRSHLPINSGYELLPGDSLPENQLINDVQESINVKKHTRFDLLTFLSAREYIDRCHPRVVLLSFGETDEYAHQNRYDMYLQQATAVDQMIAELWYYVQTNSFYRNKTTFLITTDHGRGKSTNTWYRHGIFTKGSGEIWFALLGPRIIPAGEIKLSQQFYQKQLASTMAVLLGESFEGKAISIPGINDYPFASAIDHR